MTMRMLIDARHREETRVAVVKGNRIEEFDFESAERKQLKGNIYLAKVTRVEPSLQAAFIDYGGNRHGFLAFSEIHPDYYQIPREDREALLREEAEHAAREEALHGHDDADEDESIDEDAAEDMIHDAHDDDAEPDEGDEDGEPAPKREAVNGGGDDQTVEGLRQRRTNLRHRYKIQDVIRRRQVLLVQVVKEERGNKGAALTTYLSLAGRYCVLMPNTSHGGGISRKISSPADRKRLKSILGELDLPQSMGCIVRTAGLQRTRGEIRRDFDYLARLWDEIRATTLQSSAPALVYGDSDLVKRAIRDIYNKDIDEVIVEGEEGYRQARQYMKLLMPSHAKRVIHYSDAVPLFQRGGVEDQLAAMYQPVVQLKSGGYLVINPTEALVSIDVNSGRSTREHNIEQTAVMTNLEASHEIARQLRLRDMAGLVVIDFIDMENNSNNRKVEKAMKEALKNDRARIQVGRISSFGLFEMSRQRIRTGVLEASTRPCPHCEGTGLVRTASSAGISALRMLEEEAARGRGSQLLLRCSQEASFYILNRKRAELADVEERFGVLIEVRPDGSLEGARMTVEAGGPPPAQPPRIPAPIIEADDDLIEDDEDEDGEAFASEADDEADEAEGAREPRGEARESHDDSERGKRRRRRRRRGGRREEGDVAPGEGDSEAEAAGDAGDDSVATDAEAEPVAPADASDDAAGERDGRRRRGRRGRRGARNGEGRPAEAGADAAPAADTREPYAASAASDEIVAETEAQAALDAPADIVAADAADAAVGASIAEAETADEAPAEKPRARRRPRARAGEPTGEASADPVTEAPAKRPRRRKPDAAATDAGEAPSEPEGAVAAPAPEPVAAGESAPEAKPRRTRRRKADATDAADTPTPAEAAAPADPDTAIAAEPVVEPEVVAEPIAAPETAEAGPAEAGSGEEAPARRGWWQRTFGA